MEKFGVGDKVWGLGPHCHDDSVDLSAGECGNDDRPGDGDQAGGIPGAHSDDYPPHRTCQEKSNHSRVNHALPNVPLLAVG